MAKRPYDPERDPIEQVKAMDGAQELFVPVHGHILLYPQEIAIVDHPSFQRLRRVRQLGMAHMVFPGATHTRFEHSVGAVHVAQLIVNHVNHNYRKRDSKTDNGPWKYGGIDLAAARFIRLGALLHDIGHLPFGHTLEDELHHLKPHDKNERLNLVARREFKQFELKGREGLSDAEQPAGGWSLEALINHLYGSFATDLGISASPFTVLKYVVSKPPKQEPENTEWKKATEPIEKGIDLDVCRDIVGNTICADFLDYLFRDWHHLGKPLYHDKRLYEYMEVRSRASLNEKDKFETKFVINVSGDPAKIRHDALTDILELLTARYKLAETVLFHRTKLALTGLLDRCLLETEELFRQIDAPEGEHQSQLENLLLDSSDDGLVGVLKKMETGGSRSNKERRDQLLKKEREAIETQTTKVSNLYEKARGFGDLHSQKDLVGKLRDRLDGREVYKLAYKLKMSDFAGPHNEQNPKVSKLLNMYRPTQSRLRFLRGIEALCSLPLGSLVMYCPHDATMNAKIAKVNLLIEETVWPFVDYENASGESGLTRGALQAQVQRFYELWSAYVFVERCCWTGLNEVARRHLRSVIQCFFFQDDPSADLKVMRQQVEVSIRTVQDALQLVAARGSFGNPPAVEKFKNYRFPSGLAFDKDM
jgi:HD superfamily phosphohydrolase